MAQEEKTGSNNNNNNGETRIEENIRPDFFDYLVRKWYNKEKTNNVTFIDYKKNDDFDICNVNIIFLLLQRRNGKVAILGPLVYDDNKKPELAKEFWKLLKRNFGILLSKSDLDLEKKFELLRKFEDENKDWLKRDYNQLKRRYKPPFPLWMVEQALHHYIVPNSLYTPPRIFCCPGQKLLDNAWNLSDISGLSDMSLSSDNSNNSNNDNNDNKGTKSTTKYSNNNNNAMAGSQPLGFVSINKNSINNNNNNSNSPAVLHGPFYTMDHVSKALGLTGPTWLTPTHTTPANLPSLIPTDPDEALEFVINRLQQAELALQHVGITAETSDFISYVQAFFVNPPWPEISKKKKKKSNNNNNNTKTKSKK